MIYDFDISLFVRRCTPPFLRKKPLLMWLESLLTPIKTIHSAFITYKGQKLYDLSITGQTINLERYLNDQFDDSQRRILIEHAESVNQYDYFLAEGQTPDYDYSISEAQTARFMYMIGEQTSSIVTDFAVQAPNSLNSKDAQIKANIDRYKLAAKTYSVNYV